MTEAKQTKLTQRERSRSFDEALGKRVRALRMDAGMSQAELAARLGVSHQQVKKYESGKDRLSAYAIQQIATVLALPVAACFDDGPIQSCGEPAVHEAMSVFAAIQRIDDPELRRRLVALIKELTRTDGDQSEKA